jgi:RNA polymerase sigma-70 factor, ECF subfamily
VDSADDQSLLCDIARGSREAFQCYYQRHAGRLLGYVLGGTGDRALAEDVVQEVFTAVWLKASSYRPEQGPPSAWLHVIARNKLVDRWRRRPSWEQDSGPSPVEPELGLSLRRALVGLRPEQRQAVELACLQGYTHEEAAAVLKIPLGTLKTRLRAGLGRLRALLRGEEP